MGNIDSYFGYMVILFVLLAIIIHERAAHTKVRNDRRMLFLQIW